MVSFPSTQGRSIDEVKREHKETCAPSIYSLQGCCTSCRGPWDQVMRSSLTDCIYFNEVLRYQRWDFLRYAGMLHRLGTWSRSTHTRFPYPVGTAFLSASAHWTAYINYPILQHLRVASQLEKFVNWHWAASCLSHAYRGIKYYQLQVAVSTARYVTTWIESTGCPVKYQAAANSDDLETIVSFLGTGCVRVSLER